MITTPTLLLDEKKCKENIHRMAAKAKRANVAFRPHFKTHQSLEIGRWFKDVGVRKITVSSVYMATYFAQEWNDITIAFPVNIREMNAINELAKRITLNLLVENETGLQALSEQLTASVNLFLKIDVGTHRTGIQPDRTDFIEKLLDIIQADPKLTFKGFLGHSGHTYQCRNTGDIQRVHHNSLEIMKALKDKYKPMYPGVITSIGDTPGCSVANYFTGIDEIRPGNFVFYDVMQLQIGSCAVSQISVAMACPIVAIHHERSEIVVYGGGVHFSKDRMEDQGKTIFGRVVKKTESGWGDIIPHMYVKSLSQEHGIISVPEELINSYVIGDYLILLPVHSCMTVNLMKNYLTTDGRCISKLK